MEQPVYTVAGGGLGEAAQVKLRVGSVGVGVGKGGH